MDFQNRLFFFSKFVIGVQKHYGFVNIYIAFCYIVESANQA